MSTERREIFFDITPLGYNSVTNAANWMGRHLGTGEQIAARRLNLKHESEDTYDFLIGMAQIRNAFFDRSIYGLMAYEKGFIFMLRALQEQAFNKGVPLALPNHERVQRYIDELLGVEYNHPQIDEVKKAIFRPEQATFTDFSSALVDMQGTKAVDVLEETLREGTFMRREEMITNEPVLGGIFRQDFFQSQHGPINAFELGATDIYQLYTPTEPKVDTNALNRMWDLGE